MPPSLKIWVAVNNLLTVNGRYTKTGTTPPTVVYSLRSGSTSLTSISSTGTDSDTVVAGPLTASVLITANPPTAKTVTINLIVKNITDNTTLYNPGAVGFITVGTGYTYQWVGDANKVYEVTGSASNT